MKKGWWVTLALILTAIGGINWGLVGLANFNLVTAIFSTIPILVTVIYIAVGISGIITLLKVLKVIK